MTQEEKKDLLLRDLCARLPYGVKVKLGDNPNIFDLEYRIKFAVMYGDSDKLEDILDIINIKPYLFPLSSMTEEQKAELKQEHIKDEKLYVECLTMAAKGDSSMRGKVIIHYAMDWCYKNHFDYRGLIEKGLAIDATGLNIY